MKYHSPFPKPSEPVLHHSRSQTTPGRENARESHSMYLSRAQMGKGRRREILRQFQKHGYPSRILKKHDNTQYVTCNCKNRCKPHSPRAATHPALHPSHGSSSTSTVPDGSPSHGPTASRHHGMFCPDSLRNSPTHTERQDRTAHRAYLV